MPWHESSETNGKKTNYQKQTTNSIYIFLEYFVVCFPLCGHPLQRQITPIPNECRFQKLIKFSINFYDSVGMCITLDAHKNISLSFIRRGMSRRWDKSVYMSSVDMRCRLPTIQSRSVFSRLVFGYQKQRPHQSIKRWISSFFSFSRTTHSSPENRSERRRIQIGFRLNHMCVRLWDATTHFQSEFVQTDVCRAWSEVPQCKCCNCFLIFSSVSRTLQKNGVAHCATPPNATTNLHENEPQKMKTLFHVIHLWSRVCCSNVHNVRLTQHHIVRSSLFSQWPLGSDQCVI